MSDTFEHECDAYDPMLEPYDLHPAPCYSSPPTPTRTGLCPKCRSPMVERHGRNGTFMGCSTFPKCKGTRNLVQTPKPITRLGVRPVMVDWQELAADIEDNFSYKTDLEPVRVRVEAIVRYVKAYEGEL
jgi:ssDNA-binding Zn-finger/Zn-ribbon topoisomerase 1